MREFLERAEQAERALAAAQENERLTRLEEESLQQENNRLRATLARVEKDNQRLRDLLVADGLDPDMPIPPGLKLERDRFLEECDRLRAALEAEQERVKDYSTKMFEAGRVHGDLMAALNQALPALDAIREGSWATEKWKHRQGIGGCRDLAKQTVTSIRAALGRSASEEQNTLG